MGEVFGPYRVRERLGSGGMATVHRAELVIDGAIHEVALKRLLPELTSDRSFVRRFIAEARLGQRLQHANIARTHEVGNVDGVHFIAFEYVRGPTVLDLLQRTIGRRPLPLHISVHVVTQVARALAFAHGLRGDDNRPLHLIHRDIAPSNIILSDTGATKLIDFGFAKTTTGHVRTDVGCIIGKLGYVAPEYLRGKLDPRVDLYSLGVVAYELLTARQLFGVKDLRTAELIRRYEIERPSSINPVIPAELDDIVLTALQHDPRHRWQTAYEMYSALANLQHVADLAITDRDVAAWIAGTQDARPATVSRSATMPTEQIAVDVDVDIEAAFAHMVRSCSHDLAFGA